MFKLFSKRSPSFPPSNLLEKMIESGVLQANPRDFFDIFVHEMVIVLTPASNGEKLTLETTTSIDGVRFAFVYTSRQALSFVLNKKNLHNRRIAILRGSDLIKMLLTSGLGMQINAELLEDPAFCLPEDLNFICREFGLIDIM